ncbi:MAG: hypothetical protein JNJ57_06165, partial [Saprospiraceae bacterium]|nr:hypothetical protein [Saprospiraceae bacterium]
MKEEQDQPFQLKNIYNQALLNSFAEVLKNVWSPFPVSKFMNTVFDESWPSLELKQRTRHISKAMRAHLPGPYAEALVAVEKAALHLIAQAGNDQMVFEYGFLADFVEHFGVDDPDISIPALETITRFTSAEFAVRPYLIRYPERMYAQMQDWATHESYAVRRLASEGFRSRLPWGMGVPAL